MAKILIIGSSNTDMVVKTHRFPQPGETIIGGDFFIFPGGKGANQAVSAARMGGSVVFVCKTGDDLFGRQAIEGFRKEGIDIRCCTVDPEAASGVALITLNATGENTIVVAPGANARLSEADIDAAAATMVDADIVLLQLETPLATVAYAVQRAATAGKRVMLNPAPAQTALPDSMLAQLFLLTPNETEAALLTGITPRSDADLARMANALLAKGVQNVAFTLGARGVYFQNAAGHLWVTPPKVQPIDTTGAGDVFNGALAVALAEDMPWSAALDMACRAAAISVTRMGAQSSAPHRKELGIG
jgi:ribokinase